MHFLTYVVGDKPDDALKPLEGRLWDWYVTGSVSRWHDLERWSRKKLPLPHYLVWSDSSYVENEIWNGEGWIDNKVVMKKKFDECLRSKERITVVDIHN